MKKIEYRLVNPSIYKKCLENTDKLLKQVSLYTHKSVLKITPTDIIFYFEEHYNIVFAFFDKENSARYIKFSYLSKNLDFITLHEKLVCRMSGVTIPEEERVVILLNQTMPLSRIIFTILHELCHLHFHELEENRRIFASKFSGKYPDELIPFENEANVMASLLFCPTIKLEVFLTKNLSFNKIKSMTNMSRKALHSRLLNYLLHIIKLNHNEALNLVINFKNDDHHSKKKIKSLIDLKNSGKPSKSNLSLKISNGRFVTVTSCLLFLKKLSVSELISELEYAHYTNNHTLEQLVMSEYYKKVLE